MTNEEKSIKIKQAFQTLKELVPNVYSMFDEGMHVFNTEPMNAVEQIQSAVKVYLHSKNIHLSKRSIELLVMFVQHDTSTKSREKISRKIKMSRGTINQNVSSLKKEGVLIYPFEDSKKSVVDPELIKIKNFILRKNNKNIVIRYKNV